MIYKDVNFKLDSTEMPTVDVSFESVGSSSTDTELYTVLQLSTVLRIQKQYI